MKCSNCNSELTKRDCDIPDMWRCQNCQVGFHIPKNYKKASYLYAYLSSDYEGNEGIVAIPSPLGISPLVSIDENKLREKAPLIEKMEKNTKTKIIFAKFKRED